MLVITNVAKNLEIKKKQRILFFYLLKEYALWLSES